MKTPSRKQSTKVVDDVLAGDVTPKKTPGRVGRKSLAEGMTPSMPCRAQPCKTPRTPLQEARSRYKNLRHLTKILYIHLHTLPQH